MNAIRREKLVAQMEDMKSQMEELKSSNKEVAHDVSALISSDSEDEGDPKKLPPDGRTRKRVDFDRLRKVHIGKYRETRQSSSAASPSNRTLSTKHVAGLSCVKL